MEVRLALASSPFSFSSAISTPPSVVGLSSSRPFLVSSVVPKCMLNWPF